MTDYTGTTGDDGKATIEKVPVGEYNVTASKEGYADYTGTLTVDGDEELDITLNPVDTLTITVDDGESTPTAIEGATVTIGETTKTTDANGECTFPDMIYDDYTAEISATGYVTATETIAFRSNHKSFTVSLTAEQAQTEQQGDG